MTDKPNEGSGFAPASAQLELRLAKFANVTSGNSLELLAYRGAEKQVGSRALWIDIAEIRDNGICFAVPPMTCALGHKIEILVDIVEVFKQGFGVAPKINTITKFQTMGVIKEFESDPRIASTPVFLEFPKADLPAWSVVLNVFAEKQQRSIELFRRLKGEE